MTTPRQQWSMAAAIVAIPTLALTMGALSANQPLGVLLAMAEPLLFATLMAVVAVTLLHLQHGMAAVILTSAVVGTVALHLPTEHHQPTGDGPQWLRVLRGCALLSKPAKAPVRLLTWTIDDSIGVEPSMDRFLELQPDIIVINGTDNPAVGSRLGAALDGEVKFFPSDSTAGGMTAVVRGSFQYCGGDDDHWTMPLPSAQNGGAQGLITFPHVQDVGVFPLIITRLDTPYGMNDWMEWGHRVISGAKDIADAASVIGTRKMVLMGDLQIPARSAPLATSIGKTGLRPIHSEPNWPTQIMGAPFLPLHARDQAWVGTGWHVQSARVLTSAGQIRAPIVFDLVPDTSKAP